MAELKELDAEQLLLRVSNGETLTSAELAEIAGLLEATDITADRRENIRPLSIDDIYAYITVLKRAGAVDHRHLLERFLECRDSLTVALILESLCVEWQLTADYLERVVSFALGEAWDEDEDVQQTAIKILGEYLRSALSAARDVKGSQKISSREEHVLSLLLSLYSDDSLAPWSRQSAYFALCRAAGKGWEELPPECLPLDFGSLSADIDVVMIATLQSFLND